MVRSHHVGEGFLIEPFVLLVNGIEGTNRSPEILGFFALNDRSQVAPLRPLAADVVYSKSVNFWRNHEEHLGELIEVLEPVLPRYQQYESINRPETATLPGHGLNS